MAWVDSDSQSERESANKVMSFARKYEPKSEFSDDYMIKEELDATYGLLYTKWEEACMTIENQKRTISALNKEKDKLTFTITSMEEEVTLLNSKIKHMTKSMCMLNTGYDMLDNILDIGEMEVIGLDYNKKVQIPLNKRFEKSKNQRRKNLWIIPNRKEDQDVRQEAPRSGHRKNC